MMELLRNEKGSVLVLICLCMVVIIGCAGLVVDVGNLYIQQAKMQVALDAASLAGAQELPNTVKAQEKAIEYAELNGLEASEVTVEIIDGNLFVSADKNVPFFLMSVLGFNNSSVTGSATAASGMAQCFDYTLFSGSENDTLRFNGNNLDVYGSSHTNEKFHVNGNYITVTGACQAVGSITSNGNNINIPNRFPNSSFVDMPDYSTEVKEQAEAAGNVYNSSQQYNGNNINVDGSIYVNGNVTLNGNHIYGAGAILSTGNITINGNCISATTNDQVSLYSQNNITINGNNIVIYGILYAPNGTITFNGNNITVYGKVIGNKVRINGNHIEVNGTDEKVFSLPTQGFRLIK